MFDENFVAVVHYGYYYYYYYWLLLIMMKTLDEYLSFLYSTSSNAMMMMMIWFDRAFFITLLKKNNQNQKIKIKSLWNQNFFHRQNVEMKMKTIKHTRKKIRCCCDKDQWYSALYTRIQDGPDVSDLWLSLFLCVCVILIEQVVRASKMCMFMWNVCLYSNLVICVCSGFFYCWFIKM